MQSARSPPPQLTNNFSKSTSQTYNKNQINASLTAATAAAAAAIEAQFQQQQQQQTNSFAQSPSDLKDLRAKFSQKPNETMLNSKSAMSFDQQAMADNQMGFVESRKINSIFVNQPLHQQQQPQQQQQQVPSLIYSSSSPSNTPQTATNPITTSMTVSKKAALYEQKLNEDKPQQLNSASTSSQTSVVSSRRNSFNNRTVTISPTKLTSVVQQMSSPIEDVEMLSSASSTSSSSSSCKHRKQTDELNINESLMQQDHPSNNDLSSSANKEPSKLRLSEKMKLFSSPGISTNYENQANAITKSASSTRSSVKRTSSSRFQTQVSG
jgi:hypothetical protein